MSESSPNPVPNTLESSLVRDDPEMADIVEDFVQGLSQRVAELKAANEKMNWEQLASLAHQLKGAGGSYGYPILSELAATMEAQFQQQDARDFESQVQRLEQITTAAVNALKST